MTDPRIIIAVLCGLVVGLVLVLAVTVAAYKRALRVSADKLDRQGLLTKQWFEEYSDTMEHFRRAINQRDEALARLAPFIAKRERDAKGQFVSAKKVAA